ncbi:MAG: hypothetical protein J5926_05605 [Ruminococcus sp.]|nr:hypothetical protein [Ruminococcus sp.]
MKMRCTALLLTALICMAGAASCGKVQTADDSSASLKISAATTAAGDVTTSTETGTTTTGNDGSTNTTTGTDTTTAASAETTAAAAQGEAATAAPTAAPADNGGNNETPAAQEQPQQNNETPADNGNTNTQPDNKTVSFSIDDLLSNAAGKIAELGTPDNTETAAACTSNGCDVKIYHFPDLEVQCYIDGGVEYIYDVKITGGDYTTSKGIKVGSSRADVEAAYGAGEEAGGMIIYTEGSKEMDVTYNGDTLSSIEFFTAV